jgi:hypothetical protein
MTSPAEQAFAGDRLLGREIRRLVNRYGVQTAVECGTYHGHTALALAALVPVVHTIEIDFTRFTQAQEILGGVPNVTQQHASSVDVLPGLIPQLARPVLYYLDAHWEGQFPLPGEIATIARLDSQPLMVIHDMTVPGHPDLHADDQPDGSLYDYEWVRPELELIQLPWRHYYNAAAEGLRIGVMFVVPDRRPSYGSVP